MRWQKQQFYAKIQLLFLFISIHHKPIFAQWHHLTHIVGNIYVRFQFSFFTHTSLAVNFHFPQWIALNEQTAFIRPMRGIFFRESHPNQNIHFHFLFTLFTNRSYKKMRYPYILNGAISAYINEMFVCDRRAIHLEKKHTYNSSLSKRTNEWTECAPCRVMYKVLLIIKLLL